MARPDVNVRAGPVSLDFRSYEFEQNGKPLFVFVCIQEDKRVVSGPTDTGEWNLRGRLRAALAGKRNLGQRLLEVAILAWTISCRRAMRSRKPRRKFCGLKNLLADDRQHRSLDYQRWALLSDKIVRVDIGNLLRA
jgi:hypothetical protein